MKKYSTTNHLKNRSLCSWTPDSSYSQASMTIFENSSFFLERKRKNLEALKAKRNRVTLSQSTKFASKPLLKLPVIIPEVIESANPFLQKRLKPKKNPSPLDPPFMREYETPFKVASILKKRITFKCIKTSSKRS
jgi:hypothetical protein